MSGLDNKHARKNFWDIVSEKRESMFQLYFSISRQQYQNQPTKETEDNHRGFWCRQYPSCFWLSISIYERNGCTWKFGFRFARWNWTTDWIIRWFNNQCVKCKTNEYVQGDDETWNVLLPENMGHQGGIAYFLYWILFCIDKPGYLIWLVQSKWIYTFGKIATPPFEALKWLGSNICAFSRLKCTWNVPVTATQWNQALPWTDIHSNAKWDRRSPKLQLMWPFPQICLRTVASSNQQLPFFLNSYWFFF